MNYNPRPWQVQAQKELDCSGNKLVMAPTGSGKTMFACNHIKQSGKRVLIIVHVLTLLRQWQEDLEMFGINYTTFHASKDFNSTADVVVSTFQTLASRIDKLDFMDFDILIMDEAHKSTADSYLEIYDKFPDARRIGLSATPSCGNNALLREIYTDLIVTDELSELYDQGILIQPNLISPSQYFHSVSKKLKMSGGDYSKESMHRVAMKGNKDAYKCAQAYLDYASKLDNKRTLVFCTDIAHTAAVSADFESIGVSNGVITSETILDERIMILDKFEAGTLDVIISVSVLAEGFNSKLASTAILARPTRNLALAYQIWGRVQRSAEGKTQCQIIDMCGMFTTVGLPHWNPPFEMMFYSDTRMGYVAFEELPEDYIEFIRTEEVVVMACKDNIDHPLYDAAVYIGPDDRRYSGCPQCRVDKATAGITKVDEAMSYIKEASSLWKGMKEDQIIIKETSEVLNQSDFTYFLGRFRKRQDNAKLLNTICSTLGKYAFGDTMGGGYRPHGYDLDACQEIDDLLTAYGKKNNEFKRLIRAFLEVYKEIIGKEYQVDLRVNSIPFSKNHNGYVLFTVRKEINIAIKQVRELEKTFKVVP